MPEHIVLPRPGVSFEPQLPISGPSEETFTSTFGTLLPAAQFLHTDKGKAAYYAFPPISSLPSQASVGPRRVLLIHGVQTPALGLLPLTSALRSDFPATDFVLLDLWGHGLSDTPVLPHEGALFHWLIDALLDHLGWKGPDGRVNIVGFSFGAVLTMGYVSGQVEESGEWRRQGVESYVLVAPAGLVRKSWFGEEQRSWLSKECKAEDEDRAAKWVISVLEGGKLMVPEDWQERVDRGEVVAQKVREWQMNEHKGHAASVVGIYRDGGVTDNDGLFVKAKETGIRSLVVLGADDDLSTEKELVDFGYDVKVVPQAGHGVVRDKASEVADHIGEFWRTLSFS